MEIEDMNIKIQNTSQSGDRNTGSCAALAAYLQHEDQERIEAGKDPLPFLTPDGTEITIGEVISKIDRNHSHLGKKDDKFYHISISPSAEEVKAMGKSEAEQYENGVILMKAISNNYAQNFNRKGLESAEDLIMFWKFHYTRGDNGDLQFHLHAIVSRKSKSIDGKSLKLSPMTNHRETQDGPVKGGFDRKVFFEKGEKLFDELFHYDRKVSESFAYRNALSHGTAEQKAEQAERLANENKTEVFNKIAKGLGKRREHLKEKNEAIELASFLNQDNIRIPVNPTATLADAVNLANLKHKLSEILESSTEISSLELNLLTCGITCSPITDSYGGLIDIQIIKAGRKINAKDIIDTSLHKALVNRYSRLTGIPTTSKVQQAIEQAQEKKASQEISKEISQDKKRQTIKRRR